MNVLFLHMKANGSEIDPYVNVVFAFRCRIFVMAHFWIGEKTNEPSNEMALYVHEMSSFHQTENKTVEMEYYKSTYDTYT